MVAGMRSTNARPAPGLGSPDGTGKSALRQLVGGLPSCGGAQRETVPPEPPVLLSDPRVAAGPPPGGGGPRAPPGGSFGPRPALGRGGGGRPGAAAGGMGLRVVDGYRTAAAQRSIISSYAAHLRTDHPAIGAAELERLSSRFVAPLAVAPHVAGAAADLTLVDCAGRELDLGTP